MTGLTIIGPEFLTEILSLSGPILVVISPHSKVIRTRRGMRFTLLGIALLVGTPIAGAILDSAGA
jgi:hypothetical protein